MTSGGPPARLDKGGGRGDDGVVWETRYGWCPLGRGPVLHRVRCTQVTGRAVLPGSQSIPTWVCYERVCHVDDLDVLGTAIFPHAKVPKCQSGR